MKNGITWLVVVAVLIGLLWLASSVGGLNTKTENYGTDESQTEDEVLENNVYENMKVAEKKSTNTAVFTTNKGVFEVALYGEDVPTVVDNFVKLANDGYYNGTRFHRVIKDFMVQGGDPLSKDLSMQARWGTGGPGYAFDDEFAKGLSNIKGTISMANSGANTNGSQFFINVGDNVFLDFDREPLTSKHAVFGEVVSGMDVVLAISNAPTLDGDVPVDEVVVESVVIK